MLTPNLSEKYMRRAEAAEKKVREAKDLVAKEAWERIVIGYLELAQVARRQERAIFATV